MRFRYLFAAALLILLSAVTSAQEPIPANLLQLLNAPEEMQIDCKLDVQKPVLMFQQEYLVNIRGRFSHKLIEHGGLRHLQAVTKVQDAEGRWLEGDEYDDFKVPEHLRGKDVYYVASLYLRPGKYRITVAMLDAELQKSNVYHLDIEIPPLSNDPFPQIDSLLPLVDFPDHISQRYEWQLSDRIKPIEVANAKPVRLDIVLNITKRFRWDVLYRVDMQTMLESGSMLGRFRPDHGCARLSVIDPLRMKVVLDRYPADKLNWTRLQQALEKLDQNMIDVHVLANQRRIAEFTHDYFQSLASDPAACPTTAQEHVTPVIVVVSPDMVLPNGNQIGVLTPLEHNQFTYIHMGRGSGWMDGIGQILASAKPEKINCLTPREFRNVLARVASQISVSAP